MVKFIARTQEHAASICRLVNACFVEPVATVEQIGDFQRICVDLPHAVAIACVEEAFNVLRAA